MLLLGRNAMSVDVEEHFQVSAFEGQVARNAWGNHASRVVDNVARLLDLFAEHEATATFFVLGCVAEAHPGLVRRLADAGHEVASHGFAHHRVSSQAPDVFREDVTRTKNILQQQGGQPVLGYRAASFSIGAAEGWAYQELAAAGYRYSSSVYPVAHDHYGIPDACRHPHEVVDGLLEVPLSTARLAGRNWPVSGGGWFRLMPYAYTRAGLGRYIQQVKQPAVFYFHPWEIDPDQPRIEGIAGRASFRHYVGLARFEEKLARLLDECAWGRMDEVFGLRAAA